MKTVLINIYKAFEALGSFTKEYREFKYGAYRTGK